MKHYIPRLFHFRKGASFLWAFVLLSFSSAYTYGQELQDLAIYFETDSIKVENAATFTNFIVIKNQSDDAISILDFTARGNYAGVLLAPKADFILAARSERRLPVKYLANAAFMKMQDTKIAYTLSYKSGNTYKNQDAAFYLKKEIDNTINIYPASNENFINPAAGPSSLILYVENKSYTQRNIQLDVMTIPDGLEINPKRQVISLEAQEKKMIELQVSINKNNVRYPEYSIQTTALDLDNSEVVGNRTVKLIVLSSNRQLAVGMPAGSNSNFAELAYSNNSNGMHYMQLKNNAAFALGRNVQGSMNLNLDYYTSHKLYNIYDTWIELKHKNAVARIGNIYINDYDYSISGKGAKVTAAIGKNEAIEIFGLEANYSLYGNYFPQGEGAKVAGIKYSFGKTKNYKGKLSYLFDNNNIRSTQTQIVNYTSAFQWKDIHNFRMEAGVSHEKGKLNKDQEAGVSAGLHYDTRLGKWDFQSINNYATPSYAGMNRGSYHFNQRIGHVFADNKRIFFQYENSRTQPNYLSLQNVPIPPGGVYLYPYYSYQAEGVQAGYQFAIKKWNMLFSPQIEKQKKITDYNEIAMLAYRMEATMSTSFGSQGVNISTAYAYAHESLNQQWFHSLRLTMSYRYKGISVNGSAQWNPNNVFDLNTYYNVNENFATYNLYTSYHLQAFQNKLKGSLSAGVNYTQLYKNINYNINGNLEYSISNIWSTTGYFYYSKYKSTEINGNSSDNNQVRIGVKKHFNATTSSENHKVTIVLFEDENFNGIHDENETLLTNEIVKLDNFVALTDKKGKVTFQNVPTGNYKLQVNESAGARLKMDPMIGVDRNKKIKVGLVNNIKVTGKLVEIRQQYDLLETTASGIKVYAKSEEGVIYTTVINQENEFEFFLENGQYDIYIQNDQYKYTNTNQTINVNNKTKPESLIFNYKKKDTVIKIKKF